VAQRKLLLADDSITIQKVVNLTFADEGIEVITVGDGDSAMEKMAEVKPDLVLADVNMPGLNGYQICERIRQSETLKQTPVILLVGSFEPFDEEEARRVGANDFLTKPFQSIRQLVSKVTDLLQGSAQNGESAGSEDFQNADTLSNFTPETEAYISPEISSAQGASQYGDAGMDDEMIESSNASGFALDESSKFETREVDDFQGAAKTQPLSAEDLRQFSAEDYQEETAASEEPVYQISGEENYGEQSISQNESVKEEFTMARTAPALATDDEDDILEIPFDEDEEDWEEPETPETAAVSTAPEHSYQESAAQTEFATEGAPIINEAAPSEQSQNLEQGATASAAATQLSPELIDAIAQRVVEKLSEKAVKDVAWEVVPQMADLIIKKMAEEKLKE
jgi:CheY-like chemotaxis protein